MCNCAEIFHVTDVNYKVINFDIVSLRFRKYKNVQYLLNAFDTKIRLSQGVPSEMELLKGTLMQI